MVRLLLSCVVIMIFAMAGSALAQEQLRVRTGDHDDYSRLVFDWESPVTYTAESEADGRLVIKFNQEAALPSPPSATGNILGIEILSQNPLQMSVSIPAESRTRDFMAGNRVVVDVYDPPGGRKPVAEKPAAERPAPVASAPLAAASESPAEDVVVTEEAKEAEPEAMESETPVKEEKVPPKANAISLSSITSQGLAVFESNGNIWLVNDQSDLVISPQVSGPNADYFKPIQTQALEGGRAFKTKGMKDTYLRGQGGGMLWRVIISAAKRKDSPVKPLRQDVQENLPRSGKIIWPLHEAGRVLEVPDPVSGAIIKVVTVANAKQFAGPAMEFVDFKTLNSTIGLAILPKVDDLEVRVIENGVEISRPGGLAVSADKTLSTVEALSAQPNPQGDPGSMSRRIFDFQNWQMGGIKALEQNRNIIMAGLTDKSEEARIEGVMTMAKMYLANAQGSEALGFLTYIEDELPTLLENGQFIALRGAAKAVDWKAESAFEDLSREDLQDFEEIGYWRAYALADLGDWTQAEEVMPQSLSALYTYPAPIFNRLALVLAEVALRAGDVKRADALLVAVEAQKDTLFEPQKAALGYLKGELARQRGDIKTTKELWEPLVKGKDDLYRAKAGLALTRLQVVEKELMPAQAIDNLERLRYAWRGDELEAQINYWLGKTYFESGAYAKGLNIMREAASLVEGTDFGTHITSEMSEAFTKIFLGPELDKLSPLDAGALYEQFANLVPSGPEGDQVVQKLAERLVQGDLLARASDLLVGQLENRLQGLQAYDIAVRLTAIYLLDGENQKALKTIDRATEKLKALPVELQTPERSREISLLRARALSRQGHPDQALALLGELDKTPDVNRLRADTAWYAGYWDDAAEAMNDVIIDQAISLTRPLSEENTNLILQRAVALNLANDRVALANMREKYSDPMAQTNKARIFEVITRARQSTALADRETLMGIVSEVDLFADFLKTYKSVQAPSH